MSSVKTRHYAHLAARLRQLQTNIKEAEVQMEAMAVQLGAMHKLGAYAGAQ